MTTSNIINFIMASFIFAGFVLLFMSTFKIGMIIQIEKNYKNDTTIIFWRTISLFIMLFCLSYLFSIYSVYFREVSHITAMATLVYFFGGLFVYLIISTAFNIIIQYERKNHHLIKIAETQNESARKLIKKSKETAISNANMAHLYIDIETVKDNLEYKEAELRKKNAELSKINAALSVSNSDLIKINDELNIARKKILQKKKLLKKQNKHLKETNALMVDTFKKFVPEQFLKKISKKGIEEIRYGYAEREHMSILFSGIRYFDFSQSPISIYNILNKYLSHVSKAIIDNNGFIDKFFGLMLMAIFENATDIADSSHALDAAIQLQLLLQQTSIDKNQTSFLATTPTSIGIHYGEVILGTIGTENRMSSTVLGNTVNLASRIQEIAIKLGVNILISDMVLNNLFDSSHYHYRSLGLTKIRGENSLIEIFECYDSDKNEIIQDKELTKLDFEKGIHDIQNGDIKSGLEYLYKVIEKTPDDIVAIKLIGICQKQKITQGISYDFI